MELCREYVVGENVHVSEELSPLSRISEDM